jgi:peptide/nickel transport system substrate-binding protein
VQGLGFLPLEHKTRLENNSGISLYELDLPQHRALFFNPNTNDLLKDKNIRRAIAFAIDRDRIVSEVIGGNGKTITRPILPGYSATGEPAYRFDPNETTKILEDNNWTLNEETGIRTKDDVELRFTLTTVDQLENVSAAQIVQENLAAIGIQTDIAVIERQRIKNDIIEPRNYEILLFGQITTSHQDVYAFWHSSQTSHPGNNLAIFANKDIDAALEELRSTDSPDTQQQLYETFVEKMNSETFAVFLYTPTYIYPVSSSIKGIDNLQRVSFPSERFAGITGWYTKTKRELK